MIIRKLQTHQEYLAAEDIQRIVWRFPEREVIPLNELVVAQKNGGHVFGAFDDGRMVAFCFGIPGFRDGKVYHYSRMLGVLPEYQDRGLGYRLKLAQRRYVLQQGLDLIRWTFDPLQSRNAYFNIVKLGCIAREYLVNVYGQSGSRFNQGLETDRLVPEWWIRSKRVVRPATLAEAQTVAPAIDCAPVRKGWIEARAARTRLRDPRVSIEIPDSIDDLKRQDLEAARTWRARTREAFLAYFKRGYVVHAFATGRVDGRRRSLYLLEKGYRSR
ncbi:MAG: GNAT family N-acetyltransferase [Planctomycetes bacterium]|nr:GNAT family N-acetyltransferase [Planctomycetota bacterium]